MSVESIVADEIIARMTPEINAIIGRLDAICAVQIDINQQVRDLKAAIEQAIAECPCDEAPPIDPPPVVVVPDPEPPAPGPEPAPAPPNPGPVPVTVPVPADPPGSFRWRDKLVTLSSTGQILFDGVLTPENAKTRNVVEALQGPDGLLWQKNSAGEWYRWSGLASGDYERMPSGPASVASITGSGTIAGPAVLSGAVRAP